MLDFREKLQELIADWDSDHPGNKIPSDFAGYAAPALRDAAEGQFSDGGVRYLGSLPRRCTLTNLSEEASEKIHQLLHARAQRRREDSNYIPTKEDEEELDDAVRKWQDIKRSSRMNLKTCHKCNVSWNQPIGQRTGEDTPGCPVCQLKHEVKVLRTIVQTIVPKGRFSMWK